MMKRFFQKTIPLALGAALALGLSVTGSAAYEDFTDVKDHWAGETLHQAYNDGILKGYSDEKMAPNKSITTAQAVTILNRVLHVTGQGDASGFDIPANAWYREDVAKAVYAGLLDADNAGSLNQPMSRGEAFRLFGRAFQMTGADPDLSVLDSFSDAAYLTGEIQTAAASLIASGVVSGSDDGLLHPDRPLTRAEFATILYRLADTYTDANGYTDQTGGTVLSGDAVFAGLAAGDLWFDHTSANISLTDSNASLVAVRSDALESLNLDGTGRIDKLILAANSGDVALDLPETYALGTLTVGAGSGAVEFTGAVQTVEVTGSGRTVTIDSSIDTLAISGDNNEVVLKKGCDVGDIVIRGQGNTVTLNAKADTLLLAGRDNTITGSGRIADVTLNTQYYDLDVSKGEVTKWENYDLEGVAIALTAPDYLPAGETLEATAHITSPEEHLGKLCTASWYLNGELMAEELILLGKDTPTAAITPNYTHDLQQEGTLEFMLTHIDSDGDQHIQQASVPVMLDNYGDLGLADAVITVNSPEVLPAGETLQVTASVETPEVGKVCRGAWYVDGKEVASGPFTLGSGGEAYVSHKYTYYYGMPETSTVKLVLSYTTEDGRDQQISGEAVVNLENYADNGIVGATSALDAPYVLEAGETLVVTTHIDYPQAGKVCTGTWYVDGVQVQEETIVLGQPIPELKHNYTYSEDMKLTSDLKFVLSYTTEDGRFQQIAATRQVTLKNYGYLFYHGLTEEEVLNTVTNRYAGNYTLQWALDNDYDPELKTAWVNLKGYSSNTKYLVWVNLTYQRVNIFQGSQGNWELIRECLCGAGKASTPTIRGVFTTSYKQSAWNYGSYYCGPIVRFNGASGYAFHSRLQYWPMNSDRYYDASIGYPISHGCLRMYNDDIWFMYDNIPNGTTVVVH